MKLISIFLLHACSGSFVPTYKSNPDDLPYTSWMSYFKNIPVADLPMIPASHDSATCQVSSEEDWLGIVGWLYAQTQNYSLYNQLMIGIRMFDYRLDVTYDDFDVVNSIYISHTFMSNYTFAAGLADIKLFLDEYPTEFVFLILRIDTAHPLMEQEYYKQQYIQSVLLESGLDIASVDSETLKYITVGELAGKVVIISPTDTCLPFDTSIVYLDYASNYDVCAVWQYTSESEAKNVMGQCFPPIPAEYTDETGVLYGFALDGQFNQLWPNITSPGFNNWWFENFQSTEGWQKRKYYPIGVFLIDFVNTTYTSVMLDYIMNFAYPYPNFNEYPAWEPGMNITVSGASQFARFGIVLSVMLISTIISVF
jgi:hypothetical protein